MKTFFLWQTFSYDDAFFWETFSYDDDFLWKTFLWRWCLNLTQTFSFDDAFFHKHSPIMIFFISQLFPLMMLFSHSFSQWRCFSRANFTNAFLPQLSLVIMLFSSKHSPLIIFCSDQSLLLRCPSPMIMLFFGKPCS